MLRARLELKKEDLERIVELTVQRKKKTIHLQRMERLKKRKKKKA